ncbi:RES family NAD+ phosphorylase [Streptomyces sp. NPDC059271]|uniref:RES family NAD+ phosphorylase n=1 Tax=Streptomyces sp. NPDC059271 TaxID=3346799 RepID=UPI00368992F6
MTEETYLGVRLIPAPERGVWRLGKAKEPLKYNRISTDDTDLPSGNRWSLVERGTLYCATDLQGCFAEALAPFRVHPELRAIIAQGDWPQPYYMPPGTLPRDWRTRHTLVRLLLEKEARFLDVDDEDTIRSLTVALEPELADLGIDKLTHDHVQGPDRRITRCIAAWAERQETPHGARPIQGIAYRSRFAARRCWAVFEGTPLDEAETQPIWTETEGLTAVAHEYGLIVL